MTLQECRNKAALYSSQGKKPRTFIVMQFPNSDSYGVASEIAYQMIYASQSFKILYKYERGFCVYSREKATE